MKKLSSIIILIFSGLILCGCSSVGIKHVSGEQFIQHAESMEQMNSAYGTFYIGHSPDRVYVELAGFHRLFQRHEAVIYWTEMNELPEDLQKQLKDGELPWEPWRNKK